MTELVLRNDPYEAEYPSLVKETLAMATNHNQLFAQINKDGFCTVIYNKYLFVWTYDTDAGNMARVVKLSMPSTGLHYTSAQVCVYKKGIKKTPSILCVSPEGTLRHWSLIDKPHKDHQVELNNEVAHSLEVFDEQNHVHRFVLCTTTGSYFYIEVFHDEDKKEHLVTRSLDLSSNVGIQRRMTILLLGSSAVSKENVLRILTITNQLSETEAELMTLCYKTIRIYSVNDSKLVFELSIGDVINDGFPRLCGSIVARDLKYNLLDAIVFKQGILMVLAVNSPPNDQLDFYLAYVSEQTIRGGRRRVDYMFRIDVPEHLSILSPFHESSLPSVTLHVPSGNECTVVFPRFVLLISSIAQESRNIIREEFNDFLLGVACRNNLCHLILKDMGICALRRLPRLFDLSFWRKYRTHLQKPSGDFLGRDFEHLQKAFYTFCAKDLDKAALQSEKFNSYSELNFSNVVVQVLTRFLNGAPSNDSRWTSNNDGMDYGQADKNVVIMSQLREKLSFYRMFFLFVCSFNLTKKLDIALSDQGEKTARTLLVEFGEKLLSMIDCFNCIANDECAVIENAINQLSRRFASQFDHPKNANLTSFDHFFKEVSAFEEFIPELVKCENEELEQCDQDLLARARVIAEVGRALKLIAEAVQRARLSDWSAKPSPHALTWINQPRSMKYFIQHLNAAFVLLSRRDPNDEIAVDPESAFLNELMDEVLMATERLARLVLNEQDQCQRNNSQIIAKFYDIGLSALALQLAEDFKDFTMLIRHSHSSLNDQERQDYLQELKHRFKNDNFDMCLYEYYRKNGMFEYLLEERGDRLDDFLSHHENIGWIRNIESSHYAKARAVLKNLVYEAKSAEKKATILALGKLCALCEEKVDPMIVAYFTDALTILEHQEAIDKAVAKRINPTNRPLTPQEIIDANVEEATCSGYTKALLVVAHLFSSPVEQISQHDAKKLVRHIYSAILASNQWSRFGLESAEQFKLKADQSMLASVLFRLSEMGLTQDLKNILLPEVEQLNKMIHLDASHQKHLKDYVFAELLAFKFYGDDQEERMED